MANRGFVAGLVTYNGSPVGKARVGIRMISAHATPLYYWNHRWSEDQMYSRHVNAVDADKKGRFLIPFNWTDTDAGITLDASNAQVSLQAVHPTLSLTTRASTSLQVGVDWVRQGQIILGDLPDELAGQLVPEGIHVPAFWGTDTPSYTSEILWAVGGAVIKFD